MAQAVKGTEDAITGINVTPLVDITLVLLIIFMVTAKLITGQGIPLDLPKASTASGTQTLLTLALDADGHVSANGQPVIDDTQLKAIAQKQLRETPELRTLIAASKQTSHGAVMHVVDSVREAGIVRIAFAAEPLAPAQHP
ncbi:MAG TPA: biopolymer transporter ExbD [Polyangiaceae bacterium]|jgi:biopolymer transport protein ExbD|nr:biopolymer transporter ExbD [Polyangiaceae bacterium]